MICPSRRNKRWQKEIGKMATVEEAKQFKHGFEAGISAMEKELLSDATVEAALQPFGWAHTDKRTLITLRAVLREAIHLAKEKAGK
jgi:hypothetical protein